jgi:hypothetical protein
MAATFRRADPGGDVIARNGAAVRRQLVFLSMPGFAASTCFDTSARRHHGWFDPVRGFRMEPSPGREQNSSPLVRFGWGSGRSGGRFNFERYRLTLDA